MKEKTEREYVVYELIHTARMHRAVLDAQLSDIEQGGNAHAILREISKAECANSTPPSQKQLAKALGITPAAIAMTVKKLEAEGLICRASAKDDSRRNELFLSEAGRELVRQTRATFRRLDAQTYAGLTNDEIDCMLSCLHKMQENLQPLMPNAPQADASAQKKKG